MDLYVARNKNGELKLFTEKPERDYDFWISDGYKIPSQLFPNLTWEDDPIEVNLAQVHRIADEVLENIRENITSGYPSDLVDKHFNELI